MKKRTLREHMEIGSKEFTDRYDQASIQEALEDLNFVVDQLNKIDPESNLLELIWNFKSNADACFALSKTGKALYTERAIHTIRFASLIRRLYELKPLEETDGDELTAFKAKARKKFVTLLDEIL